MRLPADATLIVIDLMEIAPGAGPAGANVTALVEAWRAEGLPLAHLRHPSGEPGAPALHENEAMVWAAGSNAFADTGLESRLDDIGVTTLALCGWPVASVEAAAVEALALGYHAFVVADACGTGDLHGGAGLSAGILPALARLAEAGAAIVDTAMTLSAASVAKARQRRDAERSKRGGS
jgi:nicotinamidase-related amidase